MEPPPSPRDLFHAGGTNPQEPPSSSRASGAPGRRLPTCAWDLFFDLPHPAASTAEPAKLVDPPVTLCPLLVKEMHSPDALARLSRLAFPEHDDAAPAAVQELAALRREPALTSRGRTFGAHLTKHDVYHVDFFPHHHTFSVLLGDGRTRAHGHVRRFLPPHADAGCRTDVGRRRPRAMVLMTRAVGGERFYSSVLKTVEAVALENKVHGRGCFAKKKDPTRAFLHALFAAHAALVTQYAELRRHGLSLNFTQAAPANPGDQRRSACDTAKTIMQENEELFRITLDKVEFGCVGRKKGSSHGTGMRIENDTVQFYLPLTLQPGFECLDPDSIPEDIASPILPLLRYVGPSHFVRLISALLCERRVVLISKSITRLSTCVRAAASVIAQGLLLWRHILIPILPPHMLRFLSVQAPYLVGILHQFASRLGKIEGLKDVLCVNLDRNELKTLNMAAPRLCVPDMLKKLNRKSDSMSAAECLANDLDEIIKADQTLWQQEEKVGGGNEKTKENGIKRLDASEDTSRMPVVRPEGPAIPSVVKKLLTKRVTNAKKRILSLEEKRQYETSVDAAVAFGRMIRSNFQNNNAEENDLSAADESSDLPTAPKYAAPSHDIDIGSVEACTVAENEGGEEDLRAALTCFFIHMYGDMGMYLSETHGTFWLDRRKFLLRKKQLGDKENSPTFLVLQHFSASTMFAIHVKSRIDDMSMTSRDRAAIMPHHIPLFDVCTKYLSIHRLDYSLINVRRIVAKTVLSCTRHVAVEKYIEIRTKALALTDGTAHAKGDASLATYELVKSSHECNTSLCVVMGVIWRCLNRTEKTNMNILLALRLLKIMVSCGPLTAIIEALDGAGKIYELKSYSDAKNVDHNSEVRQAADHVYGLLVDLSSLFCRRQQIAFTKAKQQSIRSSNQNVWADYLSRKISFTTEGQKVHALFRPDGISEREFNYEARERGPLARSFSSRLDYTPSIMALSRLGGARKSASEMYDDDEVDGANDEYMPHEAPASEEFRSDLRAHDNLENARKGLLEDVGHNLTSSGPFMEPEQFFSPAQTFASENGAGMLESFNYAVSSHGGTSESGSLFGNSDKF